MTTPNLTQNEINATQQGQQAFEECVNSLTQIVSTVMQSNQQLTSNGMVSAAGQQYGKAIEQWCNDFEDIRGVTKWMADQLEATWQQMVANENNGVDIASGITAPGLPGFDQYGQ
jgi:hypothetical protein